MTRHRVISEPRVELDVEAAFEWYENERPGLGSAFLDELRAAYDRIAEGPLKYQALRSGIRRALLKRFPYAFIFRSRKTSWLWSRCFTQAAIPPHGSEEEDSDQ